VLSLVTGGDDRVASSSSVLTRRRAGYLSCIINASRKNRIAVGSGTSVPQVNQLLKQFSDMRKMMKTMNKMGGGKRALSALNPFGR
jgi:signal recognition particle GTPase